MDKRWGGQILRGRQTSKPMTIRQPDEHTPEGGKGGRKCLRQGVLGKTASGPHAPEILILGGAQDALILTSSCRLRRLVQDHTLRWHCSGIVVHNQGHSAPRGHLQDWGHA